MKLKKIKKMKKNINKEFNNQKMNQNLIQREAKIKYIREIEVGVTIQK